MITQFHTLFTIAPSHSYYRKTCGDFDFPAPYDTTRLLRKGKLIAKVLDGTLHVLRETDESGAPSSRADGKTLRFGLKLVNPFFRNFTDLPLGLSVTPLYRNRTSPLSLDAPDGVVMVGETFRHDVTDTNRPVTVSLKDANDRILFTDNVAAGDGRSTVSYTLAGRMPGFYAVDEAYDGYSKETGYYVDTECLKNGVFGIVEITVDTAFYTSPAAFELPFSAKEEELRYYVVARNYGNTEMGQLSISDEGFSEEGRARLDFVKKEGPSLAGDDMVPFLRSAEDVKIVLFESQTKVARREQGRKKVRLTRNGDLLIANMPQPGAEKAHSTMIINISKP
jgi:hypothetical protein